MHHHLFWAHEKFRHVSELDEMSKKNMEIWDNKIIPKLVEKNVKLVISGDPTCCNLKSSKNNDISIFYMTNGIPHINNSTKWAADEINYLELHIDGEKLVIFSKVIDPNK